MKKLFQLKYILILLVLTFFAVEPLLRPGLPPTHDGEYHVIRFYEFDRALRDGDIYPRWAADLNHGYGIPLFNYVYPLPNYFGALFHAFGISFIDSFKLSLLVATVVGVLFFYFWIRMFTGSIAALTAAVFYAFAPYRFVDIYVRGSVGEVWALAWFPAFLWSITIFYQKKKVAYALLASIFFALTIFSHNILALMFVLFTTTYAAFLIFQSKNKKFFLLLTSCFLLLGLALSAIFWLPALMETKYVQGLQIYAIDQNFPELYQLVLPSWGTGFSGGSLENQMSFQIGVANLLVVFIGFIFLIRYSLPDKGGLGWVSLRSKTPSDSPPLSSRRAPSSAPLSGGRNLRLLLFFFLGWFALVFYLMLEVSKPLWHTIPLLEYFQFPWRFLSLMILICSFIAGIVVDVISKKKIRFLISIIFISTAVLLTISYTQPAYYHYRNDDHYLTRDNFIHGTNSPGDVFNTIWMDANLPLKSKKVEVAQGEAEVKLLESRTSAHKFRVESRTNTRLVADIAYFPGWELFVNTQKHNMERTKDGTMTFLVPKGKHVVELRFNDTMVRRVGTVLSLMGVLACLALVVIWRRFRF